MGPDHLYMLGGGGGGEGLKKGHVMLFFAVDLFLVKSQKNTTFTVI